MTSMAWSEAAILVGLEADSYWWDSLNWLLSIILGEFVIIVEIIIVIIYYIL